jgi:hypothetical protein
MKAVLRRYLPCSSAVQFFIDGYSGIEVCNEDIGSSTLKFFIT